MVEQYYSSRKSAFIPKGHLSLEQAIIKSCDFWYYENLRNFFAWANQDNLDREDETYEHRRLDRLAHETFNRLRGHFYDETIVAYVIRPQSGAIEPVPSMYWGSDDADNVIYQGSIKDSYNYELDYSGRVIVSENELRKAYLSVKGSVSKKSIFSGVAISYHFSRKNPELNIPNSYLLLTDAYDAFVAKINASKTVGETPQERLGRNGSISSEAKICLLNLLRSGVVASFQMMVGSRHITEIELDSWINDGGLSQLVHEIQKFPPALPNIVTGGGPPTGKPDAYVLVSADDVARYMSGVGEPSEEEGIVSLPDDPIQDEVEEERVPNGAGRPAEFDRDSFLICAFGVMWFGGRIPENRTAHAQEAVNRYARKFGVTPPSTSWAKPYIRMIWETMELKAGEEAPAPDETPKDDE